MDNSFVCIYCGYSLVGAVSERCPECGNLVCRETDTLLCWERRPVDPIKSLFGTLYEVLSQPQRTVRRLRSRSGLPIIRRATLVGGLWVLLLSISIIMFVGDALVRILYGSVSATHGLTTFVAWVKHLQLIQVLSGVALLSSFLIVALLGLATLVLLQRFCRDNPIRYDGLCIVWLCYLLPMLVLRNVIQTLGSIWAGSDFHMIIHYATIVAGTWGMFLLGKVACRVRVEWLILLCLIYIGSVYSLNRQVILLVGWLIVSMSGR